MPPPRTRVADPRLAKISRIITEARAKAGLTGTQVGERMGIGWAAYGDLERCRKPPTLERIWKVAEVLGIDPAELDPRFASTAEIRARTKRQRHDHS